ncbi:probable xyloglucan endotransglucosylase/hydrolase protein 33 [Morus notabilis]|uniref:probable xyloglucan endotransglucosylase/hydrolase protein 33 n=1 Tax=Morus notabilis TaxID=981085 RepID=UPI000CED5EC6|nr:probable xyloglucan endotransglucosylase/hydrolase protein 33 [Morus notabilis]
MAFSQDKLLIFVLLIFCATTSLSARPRNRQYTPPSVPHLTDLFPHVSISNGFSNIFGAKNFQLTGNGSMATLALDKSSGSGLASKNEYYYGFFSAAIKLPSGLSPGVVAAFYLSNANVYPHNHDEIDIELLGHDKRNDWAFQTNIYANGSVSTGREEKFYLWFDPTAEHHQYSILWNNHHIVFMVDNIPVREYQRNSAYPSVFPSKPMSVYATIWDGSEWATHGGKYPVNYKYAPFVVSFADVEMSGCVVSNPTGTCSKTSPSNLDPVEGQEFATLSKEQARALDWARSKLMFYSYCKDVSRFKVLPPECK